MPQLMVELELEELGEEIWRSSDGEDEEEVRKRNISILTLASFLAQLKF